MEGKGAGHRKVDHRFCGNPEEEEQLGLLLEARLPREELWAARRRVLEEEDWYKSRGILSTRTEPSSRKRAWKRSWSKPRGSCVTRWGENLSPL